MSNSLTRIFLTYRINQYSKKMAGVWLKLLGQLEGFEEVGAEVYALYMSYGRQVLSRFQFGELTPLKTWEPISADMEKQQFWSNAVEAAYIVEPDVLYIRYDKMYDRPHLADFAQTQSVQKPKICVEFATFPYHQEMSNQDWVEADNKNRQLLLKHVDLVFSTCRLDKIDRLANHYFCNQLSSQYLQTACMASDALVSNNTINMISVANISFWHGFDRVLIGLADFIKDESPYQVKYYIVGTGDELDNLSALVVELGLEQHVNFLGYKTHQQLTDIYAAMSVGIAGLGLHRKGLSENSALKVREYLANGIPVVKSTYDDALVNVPWSFDVAEDDSPINIQSLCDFVSALDVRPDCRVQIRNYARQQLTWNKHADMVMQKVMGFSND
ncbi:glycosyltransferase [Neptunicella sp. SCSIO 80796]|uniref:glycosyltransferase n=1 Tax=Neptunicella plasticusilytica TaxID=3117012 RepID=UPI003A4D9908